MALFPAALASEYGDGIYGIKQFSITRKDASTSFRRIYFSSLLLIKVVRLHHDE
jgi:hypothetical protein